MTSPTAQQEHSLAPNPQTFDHLKQLLLVTNVDRLRRKIGAGDADDLLADLERTASVCHVNAPPPPDTSDVPEVRAALRARPDIAGVVVIGDYDVLPPARVDESDHEEMQDEEHDRFFVWTDDCYGLWEWHAARTERAIRLPQVPVSRVPDLGSAAFMRAALSVRPSTTRLVYGLRNRRHDYADAIFALVSPNPMLTSAPVNYSRKPKSIVAGDQVYLLLHGKYGVPFRLYGEDNGLDDVCAVTRKNLDRLSGAVVFNASCWGACLSTAAWRAPRDWRKTKAVQRLSTFMLRSGALAVVGTTGVHSSPGKPEPDFAYLAGPFHDLFWSNITAGKAPAAAVHAAKVEYARGLYYSPEKFPSDRARERKTVYQFACLGLGW